MTKEEINNDAISTIKWLLENGTYDSSETAYSMANNSINSLESLSGIENNNGWIKIESEADLPKQQMECWVVNKQAGVQKLIYWALKGNAENKYWIKFFTHYQPINKPKSPLF
jgi:hypothetical protein